MGTSQGTGGRSNAATNTPSTVLSGFVANEDGFTPATRGRQATLIEGLTDGLANQIRTNAGVFWFTGPKKDDLKLKAQVTKWVKSFGLADDAMAVVYSAMSDIGNGNVRRGVKVRIVNDELRAKVAERLPA